MNQHIISPEQVGARHYDRVVAIGVDMQVDFCPGGSLGVDGGVEAVHKFNRVAEWARNHNGIVALTADWHPEVTNHFEKDGGVWPVHCVANTKGAEFHPDLEVAPTDEILRKGFRVNEDAFSGFQAVGQNNETLTDFMRPAKETVAVLIGGIATDYCVKATALDAAEKARDMRYTDIYVVEDAIAAVNLSPNDGQAAIEEMKQAGITFITTDELESESVVTAWETRK